MYALDTARPPTSLAAIQQLVKTDFDQVNALIQQNLHTDISLIVDISEHLIHSGGKRLRPLLTLLAAKAVGYEGMAHAQLAVVIEFLHTATLLHDDVVDGSTLRRGRHTANVVWGNSASVLVGDFLYSRAFQLMTELKSLDVYALLANATNTIAQGEVLQLLQRNNLNASEAHYLEVIRCKTAVLFAAAAECGVVAAHRPVTERQMLASYGLHLGMAFQMIDDWLDYAVSAEEMGKNAGDDLAEGKVTLPLIYVLEHGTPKQAAMVREALRDGKVAELVQILQVLQETHADKYVYSLAQKQADSAKAAINDLPDTVYKEALVALTDFAVQRRA